MGPLDHDWSGVVTQNTGTSSQLWGTATGSGRLRLTVTDILDRFVQDSISITVDADAEKPEVCWKDGDPPVGGGGVG